MNSAWENLQCLIYNHQSQTIAMRIFYLNIYGFDLFTSSLSSLEEIAFSTLVPPSSFQMQINQQIFSQSSIVEFDENQTMRILCEIHSYPRSFLTMQWQNHSNVSGTELVQCIDEDHSIILLSEDLCLEQRIWRLRVRQQIDLSLTIDDDGAKLVCSAGENRSIEIEFRHHHHPSSKLKNNQ